MPNHTELLELLLKNRGIDEKDWDKFLNPKYEDCYDPYLLKDMERACVRIFEAIEAKEKIVIYSDYDCDGIPSAVIMTDFLKKINYENYLVYIPDRHDEGYGLHMDAIKEFVENDFKLLITFDLGITAVDEVAYATANGLDVIITDHHLPLRQAQGKLTQNLPKAYAIINPKQAGCNYTDKMLCGAGLAFKLVQGMVKKYGEYFKINEGWEKWLLDMAGIATLSDQVPLLDENRIFAYYGLKVLRKNKRVGLAQFFKNLKVDATKITEDDIAFTLAPKINAASRMGSPMQAFELLAESDIAKAGSLADHLIKLNDERKYLVAGIMKNVNKILSKKDDKKVIVIGNPDWRPGVLGIVASKIVDEYKKPAFVWGRGEGEVIKGSCRSFGSINLVEIMTSLPENSLIDFGGHVLAGGFSVHNEEIHFLEERIISVYENFSFSDDTHIDSVAEISISIDDMNMENYKVIEKLAPFGVGNPKPIFLFEDLPISEIKEFGKDKNHLEIIFLNSNVKKIKAIAFFKTRGSFSRSLTAGEKINLTAVFELNTYLGKTELRLRIIDIK